ncbi:hypothetical protein APY03_6436 [Variovorax sp. WDL1]|nr:hypothetical protein APY03_6436 [Variovorax sp. WDL1]
MRNAYGSVLPPRCFLEAPMPEKAGPIGQRGQFTGKSLVWCDRPVTRKVNFGFVRIPLTLIHYKTVLCPSAKFLPAKMPPKRSTSSSRSR